MEAITIGGDSDPVAEADVMEMDDSEHQRQLEVTLTITLTRNIPLRSTLTTLQWMANHVNPFVTLTLTPTQS